MLDLSLLELECLDGIGGRCQVQGVEGTTGVEALLGVKGSVTEELNAAHKDGVGNSQLVDVEGKVEVGVLGLSVLEADSVLPCDTGGSLSGEHTESAKHSPTAVDELSLPETLEAKDLGVGGERVTGDFLLSGESTDNAARLVHSSILVELIDINLEVLGGLGETQGIEAAIARKGSIEPVGADGVGQPQSLATCR